MATLKKNDHAPNSKKEQNGTFEQSPVITLVRGGRALRVKAGTVKKFETPKLRHATTVKAVNALESPLRAAFKGAGSVSKLMPSSPLMIKRGKVGSFSETKKRAAQTWNKAFQVAKG
jgi:hypothetical protein